jgi:hypothetical protein
MTRIIVAREDKWKEISEEEVPSPEEIEAPPPREIPGDEDLFLALPSPEEIAAPPAAIPGEAVPAPPPEYAEETQHVEDPGTQFEEVFPAATPLEEKNRRLSIRQKIAESLNTFDPATRGTLPIQIKYRTLPDDFGSSSVTDRMVSPDHVRRADTGRDILLAWCHLTNGWRAFAIENILDATLLGEE